MRSLQRSFLFFSLLSVCAIRLQAVQTSEGIPQQENAEGGQAQSATPRPIRVPGGEQAAKLISKVEPKYPPLAKMARIQGSVQLEVVISRGGAIKDLKVISGHPLLVKAALDAVQRWRYQPTLVHGEPGEVITDIQVFFLLERSPVSAEPQIDPAKEGDIRRILELTGTEKTYSSIAPQLGKTLGEALEKKLPPGGRSRQIVETFVQKYTQRMLSETVSLLIQFYDKNFTHEEIKGLVQFYRSPLGRKMIQASSQLVQDIMRSSEQFGAQLTMEILSEMEKDYPELKQMR